MEKWETIASTMMVGIIRSARRDEIEVFTGAVNEDGSPKLDDHGHVEYRTVPVPPEFFIRGWPNGGDYYIVHSDGRETWLPRAIFLEEHRKCPA